MITILAAAALSITIDLGPKPKAPKVTCHKGAVSYVFTGKPGVKFTYDGRSYAIPQNGSIELVNDGGKSKYVLAGEAIDIQPGTLDQFGTQTIKLVESLDTNNQGGNANGINP